MNRLLISARHLHAIEQHSASTYPEECCGVLMGLPMEEDRESTLVHQVLPARNDRSDRRSDRYIIPPETVVAAHKEARAKSLEVVGYYHSHPDRPAEPSDYDHEHAWPDQSYVIVSVEKGRPVATRCWRLSDDRQRFEEEALEELTSAMASGSPGAKAGLPQER